MLCCFLEELVRLGVQCIHVCLDFRTELKRNNCWSPKYLQIWLCWIWNPAFHYPDLITCRSNILFDALDLINFGNTFTENKYLWMYTNRKWLSQRKDTRVNTIHFLIQTVIKPLFPSFCLPAFNDHLPLVDWRVFLEQVHVTSERKTRTIMNNFYPIQGLGLWTSRLAGISGQESQFNLPLTQGEKW